jgi:hypothetical protein
MLTSGCLVELACHLPCFQINVGIVVAVLVLFLTVRECTFASESKRWWAQAIIMIIECGRISYFGLALWSSIALLFPRLSSDQPRKQVFSPYDVTCNAINNRGVFLPLLSVPLLPPNATSPDSFQTFTQFTHELSAWRSTDAVRSDFTFICQRANCNATNVTVAGTSVRFLTCEHLVL